MNIQQSVSTFAVTPEDIQRIRLALHAWGKPQSVIDAFDGARLHTHFARWTRFVTTHWNDWDISEYDHDLGCRYWIQVAIEYATLPTRRILEAAVQPIDEQFKTRAVPCATNRTRWNDPLTAHPYFWELHTIHPELSVSEDE